MDPMSNRVARRFLASADTQLADCRVQKSERDADGNHTSLPSLEVRAKAAEDALRQCIDEGGHKWDAIFVGLAAVVGDPVHMDYWSDTGALQLQDATSEVLLALQDNLMVGG
jgi:hypothetical protein